MKRSHLSDDALFRSTINHWKQERGAAAELVGDLAEIETRGMHLRAGYQSMHEYCAEKLGMSEEAAYKHIRVARVVQKFPIVLDALVDGRLHFSGVVTLASRLTLENAAELVTAAAHKSRSGIELMLAHRFPRLEVPSGVRPIPQPLLNEGLSPGTVVSQAPPAEPESSPEAETLPHERNALASQPLHDEELSPGTVMLQAPAEVGETRPKVEPLSPQKYALQVTLGQEEYDDLRYAQALLGHRVAENDLCKLLGRALKALVRELEKTKFAATTRARRSTGSTSTNPRQIPAHVKRTVWELDGGRCTFVSDTGRRCTADSGLEFHHVEEVARGAKATVSNLRLVCRPHNAYEAERTFGPDFIQHKREEAQQKAAERRARREAKAEWTEETHQIVRTLRRYGCSAEEARAAAEHSATLHDGPIEERVRAAIAYHGRARYRDLAERSRRPTTCAVTGVATSALPARGTRHFVSATARLLIGYIRVAGHGDRLLVGAAPRSRGELPTPSRILCGMDQPPSRLPPARCQTRDRTQELKPQHQSFHEPSPPPMVFWSLFRSAHPPPRDHARPAPLASPHSRALALQPGGCE